MKLIKYIFILILLFPNFSYGKTIIGKPKEIDGDTIHIKNNKIRLHGIDAPETKQTCKIDSQDWFCGKQSTDELKKIINNQRVKCIVNDIDIYNRYDLKEIQNSINNNQVIISYFFVAII